MVIGLNSHPVIAWEATHTETLEVCAPNSADLPLWDRA